MPTENCRHLLHALSDYLDGEATQELCAEIERHLAECDDCTALVDTARMTVGLYHHLPQPIMSADAKARLFKTLDLTEYLKADP
ncbi:MAG: zf-HC2 domain-containing protein [Chloroflexi bacterium]|nr:zf-HC2 domain-containing protein [Chloroflexota bacterium]